MFWIGHLAEQARPWINSRHNRVTAQLLALAARDFGAACACRAPRSHDPEPPRIKERSGAATRWEIIEPRNREGLVAEQIEVTIRTDFEVTEGSAGFGQGLVGKPDGERNKLLVPFFNRPPLTIRQSAATGGGCSTSLW